MGIAYQEVPPDEIRQAAWAHGRLTALQLFRIVAWKSAKGLASLTLNSEDEIERHTSATLEVLGGWRGTDVLDGKPNWERWEDDARSMVGVQGSSGLLALSGIGYPVASALLAFLAPSAFPVIDRWAVRAVWGDAAVKRTRDWQCAAGYVAYARNLVSLRGRWPTATSIHELDVAAMNHGMHAGPLDAEHEIAFRLPPRSTALGSMTGP